MALGDYRDLEADGCLQALRPLWTYKSTPVQERANKYDDGKPPLGLIPYDALVQMANVLAHGAKKYSAHQWRSGIKWQRLIDAALRHIAAFNAGEDNDPESGLSHLAHATCCLAFLMEFHYTHPELDNRYKGDKNAA